MADPRFFPAPQPQSLADLCRLTGAHSTAPSAHAILLKDVAPLDSATPASLSFFDNRRYVDTLRHTKAGACFIASEMADALPAGTIALLTDRPYRAYALAARAFYPHAENRAAGIDAAAIIDDPVAIGENVRIDAGAVVSAGAEIGDGTRIGANSVIGPGVRLGRACDIGPNVSIICSLIGDSVTIYAGARIGQDGFGFAMDADGHVPIPQLGRVLIGNSVSIGANTTIDRGAGPDTVIEDGVMIDNLVQIGHNVRIGAGCVIVAQSGISGSASLDRHVVLAAQSGIAGHLRLGAGARVAAKSGVMRDVPAGAEVMGYPAVAKTQFFRQIAKLARLATGKGA